jgi:hypothetical protein
VLDDIQHEAAIEVHKEEPVVASETLFDAVDPDSAGKPADTSKKPRNPIEDEHRETGGVKWSIYNTYLKAS